MNTHVMSTVYAAKHPDLFASYRLPANTTRLNNDALMLAKRLRRWPNNKTSLFQRVVFAGLSLCGPSAYFEVSIII